MKEIPPSYDVFPVNSYVLLKPPEGTLHKLRIPKAAGSYIVVWILGDNYSIQELLTHKVTDTHVFDLCEFRYDSSSSMDPSKLLLATRGNSLSKGSLTIGGQRRDVQTWYS
jgi:hypothetical protein